MDGDKDTGHFWGGGHYESEMTFKLEYYHKPSSGLSGGAIAGIVIGCVAFVCLVGIGIYCLVKRKGNSGGEYVSHPG